LPLFMFEFCWFTELIMLDAFLTLTVSSIPFWILFFSGLSCLWLFFFLFCVKYSCKYILQWKFGRQKPLQFIPILDGLISSSKLRDSFAGQNILGWQLLSLWTWITLLNAFLAFRVCAERSEVILMCLPLHVS
jgi:hypothetical protein